MLRHLAEGRARLYLTTFAFCEIAILQANSILPCFMPLVRILVDGYSLLHNWPELAPGKPRHSAAARDELIHWVTQYRDVIGTPITIVFDGAGAPPGTPKPISSPELEVLYSGAGQTADDIIERV